MDSQPDSIKQSVRNNYDSIAKKYSADINGVIEDQDILDLFISNLEPHGTVLDLGGGIGQITNFLQEKGYNAICYDFSEQMMKQAKSSFPNINYILDDMTNIGDHFDGESLDGIIAFYSLFHIPKEQVKETFSAISKLLKRDGIFCFNVQLGDGEEYVNEPYLEEGKKVLYFNYFSNSQINNLLEENNLDLIFQKEKTITDKNEPGNGNKIFIICKKK